MAMKIKQKAFTTKHSTGTPFDHYESITGRTPKRSRFNLSHSVITSFNAGKLVPILCQEVLPGDTWRISQEEIARLVSPLVAPVMGDIHLEFDAFFVPNRVALDNVIGSLPGATGIFPGAVGGGNIWKQFMGENMISTSGSDPFIPTRTNFRLPFFLAQTDGVYVREGSILDYLYNLPRQFNLANFTQPVYATAGFGLVDIYNYWYRDQNTQPYKYKLVSAGVPGPGSTEFWTVDVESPSPNLFDSVVVNWNSDLLKVNKKHDYFTSGLPLSWKPLQGGGATPFLPDWLNRSVSQIPAGSTLNLRDSAITMINNSSNAARNVVSISGAPVNFAQFVRTCMALNLYLEQDVRYGTRYSESIYSHFKVRAGEYRLDYAEFLGSHNTTLGLCQIPQTSSTDSESPQGNLAAFGMTSEKGFLFDKTFMEHGFVYVLCMARVRQVYQNGLEKQFTRGHTRLDYYSPEFRHLNMQPIRISEIYAPSGSTDEERVFCWSDSWQDYRAIPSRVTGQMRSNGPINPGVSLDYWHYAVNFTSQPFYGGGFLVDNTQELLDRSLSVTSSVHNQIILEVRFNITAYREIPIDGTPMMADHL